MRSTERRGLVRDSQSVVRTGAQVGDADATSMRVRYRPLPLGMWLLVLCLGCADSCHKLFGPKQVSFPAQALPPGEKIVIIDSKLRALQSAEMSLRIKELGKAHFCSQPDNKRYVVSCRQYSESSPRAEAVYRKALADVGRPLTECEDKWSGYQSLKDAAKVFRIMGSKSHYPDGGLTTDAVDWLSRADEQTELARKKYESFKQAGCIVMRKDGLGNIVPLRSDDPLKEWS
jgi:hypothetical protein